MPHGHCYLWTPQLVWLQVISNALIGLSYMAISITLAYLVYRVRDIPFQRMYLGFGLFIVTCGFTHFMDIWTVWNPIYWSDGAIRAITAIASVGTAILLPPLIPKAVALAQGAKAARDRGIRVETAYDQLGKVFEKTKELDELKTQFFANVSHELRTPLALILGPADRMKSAANLSDEQHRDLDVITRNARSLLKHVNDLLDVAKLEAGKLRPSYAQEDLSRLIRLMVGNFDGLARERNIDFEIDVPKSLPVQIDPDMIQRVLLNLLSNAFKVVSSGGKIRVSATMIGDKISVAVQDNGPGVPVDLRDAIFERFRQAEGGATRSLEGTGLGLSIAKEFVGLHKGNIAVSDAPGGGAVFIFELPIAAPKGAEVKVHTHEQIQEQVVKQALEELGKSVSFIESVAQTAKHGKGHVLVVEDNPDMNRFIAETLSEEYRTESAFNGREGLEKVLSNPPDLILSDIMMPVMSGDQMVDEIRKNRNLSGIPIILLTAKADDNLRNRLLRESAQDYVIKPFSSEELLARVKNLVTMKRAKDSLQHELSSQLQDLEVLAHELTKRKRELQGTVEKFRMAKEEAEKASRAKSTFLGMVSHEMKTPITSLKLQLEMLRRSEGKNLSPKQKALIEKIDQSSNRSVQLMNTLFEYTKLQSGKIEPRAEYLNLISIVKDLIETQKAEAQEKNLVLSMAAPPTELPLLQSDGLLVQMVIRNLLTNAIKYTDSGSVEVSLSFENGQHHVAVKDTGPGIPKELQTVIFEPFEQLTPLERKSKPGFGLGLSIAKETIHTLGGEIELSSEPGKGSTFVANLPPLQKAA